jgi:hypothetical protein
MANNTAGARIMTVDRVEAVNMTMEYSDEEDDEEGDEEDDDDYPWAKRSTPGAGPDTDEDAGIAHEYLGTLNGLIALAHGFGRTQCPCCMQTFKTKDSFLDVLSMWYSHGMTHSKSQPKGPAAGHHVMCGLLKEAGYHTQPIVPQTPHWAWTPREMSVYMCYVNAAFNGPQTTKALKTIKAFKKTGMATVITYSRLGWRTLVTHSFNYSLYDSWNAAVWW